MTERSPELKRIAERAARFHDGVNGFANSGRVNFYRCERDFAHMTVTIDREPGVTPFMIRCPHCEEKNFAQSAGYRVATTLEPTHEWYRPDSFGELRDQPWALDHVKMGGLLLRKIEAGK